MLKDHLLKIRTMSAGFVFACNGDVYRIFYFKISGGSADFDIFSLCFKATKGVHRAHLYQAYKSCFIREVPPQTYGNDFSQQIQG